VDGEQVNFLDAGRAFGRHADVDVVGTEQARSLDNVPPPGPDAKPADGKAAPKK